MSEQWNTGAGGEDQQYGGRSYGNSNYRGGPGGPGGPRRGGPPGGGYGAERSMGGVGGGGYQGSNGGGGFGGQRRGGPPGGYNGAGGGGGGGYQGSRPNYGDRPQRPFGAGGGGGGGGGGGYGGYPEGSASSLLEIDSNKVGMVIGRQGAKIREIQESFNVHVKIGEYKRDRNQFVCVMWFGGGGGGVDVCCVRVDLIRK